MTTLGNNIRERVRNWWRLPPWPLHEFSQMPPRYRAWFVVCYPLLVCAIGAVWAYGLVQPGELSTAHLVAAVAVMALNTTVLMRESAMLGAPTDLMVALPLIATGHTYEALIAMLLFHVIGPTRKPVVRHLALANIINAVAIVTVSHLAFRGSSTEPMLGPEWLLGLVTMWAAVQVYVCLIVVPPMIIGGYVSLKEAAIERAIGTSWEAATLVPLVAMVSSTIFDRSPIYLAFALVPAVVTAQALFNQDQLIDATKLAETDPLTGLMNRRSLDRMLSEINHRVNADGTSREWIIFCDLDNFKQLNDIHGHDAGDEALVVAANEIRSSLRGFDLCARFGGEEFVVFVRDVDRDGVVVIAERIRRNIEARLSNRGTTASIGVHGFRDGEDPADALNAADLAMYVSKTSGKNRITFSDDASAEQGTADDGIATTGAPSVEAA